MLGTAEGAVGRCKVIALLIEVTLIVCMCEACAVCLDDHAEEDDVILYCDGCSKLESNNHIHILHVD